MDLSLIGFCYFQGFSLCIRDIHSKWKSLGLQDGSAIDFTDLSTPLTYYYLCCGLFACVVLVLSVSVVELALSK